MFTIRKLRRRLTKHFARFRALQVDDTHHHINLYRTVLLLHAYIGDEEAPNIMSSDQWAHLPLILNSLQSRIEKTEDNFQELKSLMPTPFPVQGYLEKITSISQNITALLNAASSPRLKAIFALSFTVTNLAPITETYELPTMSNEWDSVIVKILNEKNRTREFSEDECELTKLAWEDAEYVATKGPHIADAPVHCECNIIQHFLKPGQSPIYSYIGVSKLSCRGCWEYIAAVNEVYGARYQTKRAHVKWYYPWGFASISRESQVAAIMFTKIAQKIGRVYPGFRSKTAATQSDNETQSLSPDDEPSSDKEDDDVVKRLVEEAGLR